MSEICEESLRNPVETEAVREKPVTDVPAVQAPPAGTSEDRVAVLAAFERLRARQGAIALARMPICRMLEAVEREVARPRPSGATAPGTAERCGPGGSPMPPKA